MFQHQISLSDNVPGCDHFKWHEVLFCPKWDVFIYPTASQYHSLIDVVQRLDRVRKSIGSPITITSGLRPGLYNILIGGSKFSQHCLGKALDFVVRGMTADEVRSYLVDDLELLCLRMEKLPGSNWVHIDTKEPGASGRFFNP